MADKKTLLITLNDDPYMITLDEAVFYIERILIFLLPFFRFPSCLGFIVTNVIAARKPLPPVRPPDGSFQPSLSWMLNELFWVERMACVLLLISCVGRVEWCWYAAMFMFYLVNMSYVTFTRCLIDLKERVHDDNGGPLVSETKSEKEMIESAEEQREISEEKEGANEAEDSEDSDDETTDEIESETNEEIKDEIESKEIDASDQSDININLNLVLERREEDGKPVYRVQKLVVHESEEERESSAASVIKALRSHYAKKLEELNASWEEKLKAEKELLVGKISNQLNRFEGFLGGTNYWIHQDRLAAVGLEVEKEAERNRWAKNFSENFRRTRLGEFLPWEVQRQILIDEIRAYEERIKNLEEELAEEKQRSSEFIEEIQELHEELRKANAKEWKRKMQACKKCESLKEEKVEVAVKSDEFSENVVEENATDLCLCEFYKSILRNQTI